MKLSQRVSLAFFVCLPVLAGAQQAPAPALKAQIESAPPPAKGRIHLDVVVTDKFGKPVTGLEGSDFTLLDGNQPASILSFHAVDGVLQKAAPPVEILLVIDTINASHQQVALVRDQIEGFLHQNGGHLAQPVSIFILTDNGVDAQRLPSSDGSDLAAKLDQKESTLRTIGRAAGAWGAIERVQMSVRMLMNIVEAEAKKPGRKLMIWAGSGWPMLDSPNINSTNTGRQQEFDAIVRFSTRLREARIALYSISEGVPGRGTYLYQDFLKGIKTADKADPPYLSLKVLAVQSGGRVVGPDNDLTAQINACVQDAAAFYTLSFDPPKADRANEYHDLKVTVDKPGLSARTRTGYYNQP